MSGSRLTQLGYLKQPAVLWLNEGMQVCSDPTSIVPMSLHGLSGLVQILYSKLYLTFSTFPDLRARMCQDAQIVHKLNKTRSMLSVLDMC